MVSCSTEILINAVYLVQGIIIVMKEVSRIQQGIVRRRLRTRTTGVIRTRCGKRPSPGPALDRHHQTEVPAPDLHRGTSHQLILHRVTTYWQEITVPGRVRAVAVARPRRRLLEIRRRHLRDVPVVIDATTKKQTRSRTARAVLRRATVVLWVYGSAICRFGPATLRSRTVCFTSIRSTGKSRGWTSLVRTRTDMPSSVSRSRRTRKKRLKSATISCFLDVKLR